VTKTLSQKNLHQLYKNRH